MFQHSIPMQLVIHMNKKFAYISLIVIILVGLVVYYYLNNPSLSPTKTPNSALSNFTMVSSYELTSNNMAQGIVKGFIGGNFVNYQLGGYLLVSRKISYVNYSSALSAFGNVKSSFNSSSGIISGFGPNGTGNYGLLHNQTYYSVTSLSNNTLCTISFLVDSNLGIYPNSTVLAVLKDAIANCQSKQ